MGLDLICKFTGDHVVLYMHELYSSASLLSDMIDNMINLRLLRFHLFLNLTDFGQVFGVGSTKMSKHCPRVILSSRPRSSNFFISMVLLTSSSTA